MRAVIFDLDGVIVDSEPIWREVQVEVFDKLGADIRHFLGRGSLMGMRVDEVVAYLRARLSIEAVSNEQIVADIVDGVVAGIERSGTLLPGVLDALAFCDEHGLKLAVASGSVPVVIDAALERFDLRKRFMVVHSALQDEYGKPHPSIFLRTAAELDVVPERCLVIEDSINGCVAAKAARMRVIAIPARRIPADPRFAIADVRLDSLMDFATRPATELLGLDEPPV